jgi:hypothetical protein
MTKAKTKTSDLDLDGQRQVSFNLPRDSKAHACGRFVRTRAGGKDLSDVWLSVEAGCRVPLKKGEAVEVIKAVHPRHGWIGSHIEFKGDGYVAGPILYRKAAQRSPATIIPRRASGEGLPPDEKWLRRVVAFALIFLLSMLVTIPSEDYSFSWPSALLYIGKLWVVLLGLAVLLGEITHFKGGKKERTLWGLDRPDDVQIAGYLDD